MTQSIETLPLACYIARDAAIAIVASAVDFDPTRFELQLGAGETWVPSAASFVSIETDRLNRLAACNGGAPLDGWRLDNGELCARNFSPDWTLKGEDTGYLFSSAGDDEQEQTARYVCPVEGERLRVEPNTLYSFSMLCGLHRASGRIRLSFFDESSELQVHEFVVPASVTGGRTPSDYALSSIASVSPSRARYVSVEAIKGRTEVGDNSFMFFAEPVLRRGVSSNPATKISLTPDMASAVCEGRADVLYLLPMTWVREDVANGSQSGTLVDRTTGQTLATVSLRVSDPLFELSDAALEGTTLRATVARIPTWQVAADVSLWADGEPVGRAEFRRVAVSDFVYIPIPLELLDGQVHSFEVKGSDGRLLSLAWGRTTDNLVPWSTLVREGAEPANGWSEPAAEYRYHALAKALTQASQTGKSADERLADLRNLAQAHSILTRGIERPQSHFPPLHFDDVADPLISIVIPAHNQFAVTYNCLAAILLAGSPAPYEVIIVDDGSTDETTEVSEIVRNIRCVRNEHAQGFVGACNKGAAACRGAYIVFLNNDTEPTFGWIDELLYVFNEFGDAGLAGAKLVYPNGRLQDAGGIVWETGDPGNVGRGGNPKDPRYCYSREVDYLTGAAIMIPRRIWQDVGGFEEDFAPAYFEDVDLAFKVRAAGYRVIYASQAVVFHYEGISNGTETSNPNGLKRFQEINRPKFKARWKEAFRGKGAVGQNLQLAKDRGISGRALFIDVDVLKVDENAGGYAGYQDIRIFQSLGFKVTFLPTTLNYFGRHSERLQRAGVEVLQAPFTSALSEFLSARGREFDLIFVTRYQAINRVGDLIRRFAPGVPILCNVSDLHYLRAIRAARLSKDAAALKAAEAIKADELQALSRADLILTYSVAEKEHLERELPASASPALLPWVLEPAAAVVPFERREGIAFLGGFSHEPNIAAVEFFVSSIMPGLRRRLPGIVFNVYGSGLPERLRKSAQYDVRMIGYVTDIATVFDRCRVFVAPLTFGAGVKGKVLDCAAAGVPSVLSPIAAEGIPLTSGLEAIIAQSPQDWIEAIAELYENAETWRAMSAAAIKMVQREYGFAGGQDATRAILRRIGIDTSGWQPALHPRHARPPKIGARS